MPLCLRGPQYHPHIKRQHPAAGIGDVAKKLGNCSQQQPCGRKADKLRGRCKQGYSCRLSYRKTSCDGLLLFSVYLQDFLFSNKGLFKRWGERAISRSLIDSSRACSGHGCFRLKPRAFPAVRGSRHHLLLIPQAIISDLAQKLNMQNMNRHPCEVPRSQAAA